MLNEKQLITYSRFLGIGGLIAAMCVVNAFIRFNAPFHWIVIFLIALPATFLLLIAAGYPIALICGMAIKNTEQFRSFSAAKNKTVYTYMFDSGVFVKDPLLICIVFSGIFCIISTYVEGLTFNGPMIAAIVTLVIFSPAMLVYTLNLNLIRLSKSNPTLMNQWSAMIPRRRRIW